MRPRTLTKAIAATLVLALVPAANVSTAAGNRPKNPRVPRGFVGMTVDGPAIGSHVNLAHELDLMVASGVESIRVPFNWYAQQPYRSFSQVPPSQRSEFQDVNGVPTLFQDTDRIVTLTAERGLSVLPVVQYTPGWAALHPGSLTSPPASPATYANFVGGLVRRYGSRGAFWTQNPQIPRVPIRMWQIWNEPESPLAWSEQPSWAPSYVKMLRAARVAVKAADPSAKVVLGGLTNFSWDYLAQIYKVPGARGAFDVVAVHPYTKYPSGVVVIIERNRNVMNRAGDGRKPILATELGWPSSRGHTPQYGFETTEAGQAQRLTAVLPLLARRRRGLRLIGFYYYTWMGTEPSTQSFDYAGLLRFDRGQISFKPVYSAFRRGALAIEHCRRKANVATRCLLSSG